ncbi:MAG TPA: universal stress protein [Pyrinomonadaceae bacterium]|nr:universal stress protein [Pyrinomonadaceae bacterium]
MTQAIGPGFSIVKSVLHPTDFSESSLVAFHHALKTAMLAESGLTLLHVSAGAGSQWSNFPGIRETLERWGVLPKGSPKSAVAEVGVMASKVVATEGAPVEAVLRYLERHPADLIVLATSRRGGPVRWLGKSVSAPVTNKAGEMTLLIPGDARGFVSGEDGSVKLNRILIPVAATPRPEPALKAAARFVQKLNCPEGTFIVLHVGDSNTMPAVRYPEIAGWTWKKELRTGDVIEGIVKTAKGLEADLIVMSTDGRNGFLDGLRGSHSERVLRNCAVPLLTIPVGSRASRFLI